MLLTNSSEFNYSLKKCTIAKQKDITGQIKGPVNLLDGTYFILLYDGNYIVDCLKI